VAAGAAPGNREIRLVTPGGVSSRFRFVVGEMPEVLEVLEVEPNSERARAQVLGPLPVLVNGQILPGDRDHFRFRARAGEMLVSRVEARRLNPFLADAVPGWADLCLTLYDAGGRELASTDDAGRDPDPVLVWRVPRDGEYVLEVRDILFRGRADFVYRLAIGALPHVTHVYPLGARRGTTARVQLFGVNLPVRSLAVPLPAGAPAARLVGVGPTSNAVPFAAGDAPELEEREPNDTPARAQRVPLPVTVNGRIGHGADEDCFVFAGRAGERLVLEVQARRLGSPLDAILTLLGPKAREIAENDDAVDLGEGLLTHHADSRLVVTLPTSGDYVVRLRDIQGKGGPEHAYRLHIAPVRPDFALRVSPDNPHLGKGGTAVLMVTAVRKDGFAGEIALAVEGLPPGFAASAAAIPAGQTLGYLTLTAPPDAAAGFLTPVVVGRATVQHSAFERRAFPAEEMMQAFSYRHVVPTEELLLSVREAPPFTPTVRPPAGGVLEVAQGGEAQVVVRVARGMLASDRVVVTAGGAPPPPGVTVKPAFLEPGTNEVTVTVRAAPSARPGSPRLLVLAGTTRVGRRSVTGLAPGVPLRITARAQGGSSAGHGRPLRQRAVGRPIGLTPACVLAM
jgi:hypothetical protein